MHFRPQKRTGAEGVYSNFPFMHAVTSQVGNTVQVQTKSGVVFEGIFNTYSPQFEVSVECQDFGLFKLISVGRPDTLITFVRV